MDNNPVQLKKVNEPTEDQSLSFLKSIDSSLKDVPSFKKYLQKDVKTPRKISKTNLKKDFIFSSPVADKNTGLIHNGILKQISVLNLINESIKKLSIPNSEELKKVDPEQKEPDQNKNVLEEVKKEIAKRDVGIWMRDESSKTEKRFKDPAEVEELLKKGWVKGRLSKEQRDQEAASQPDEKEKKTVNLSLFQKMDELAEKIAAPLKKGFAEIGSTVATGLLGPMNLIISPLQETFGVKFTDMFGAGKGKKTKPKRNSVIKTNPESVYVVDELTKVLKKDKKAGEEGGGFLDGLGDLGKVAQTLFPTLMKALPLAALAGGMLWGIFDGVAAMAKADNWGVDSISAFIGGFFGGKDEGWKNVPGGIGKGALLGLGIGGVVGGPVGMIIGGLLGAVLGGILAYIGAEKIAKWVDPIVKDVQANPKNYFMIAGALSGAVAGGLAFGLPGAIVGALIGAALGGVLANIWGEENLSGKQMLQLALKDSRLAALAGAGIGGGIGFAVGGPVGFVVGAILGAALGGILAAVGGDKISKELYADAIKRTDFSQVLQRENTGKQTESDEIKKQTIQQTTERMSAGTYKSVYKNATTQSQREYLDLIETRERTLDNINDYAAWKPTPTAGVDKDVVANAIQALNKSKKSKYWEVSGLLSDMVKEVGSDDKPRSMQSILKQQLKAAGFTTELNDSQINMLTDMTKNKETLDTSEKNPKNIRKFHGGGMSGTEQVAILRKNEEVLSPFQSKMYRQKMQETFDKDINIDLNQISKAIENSFSADVIVDALRELIDVVQNKPFNNVIQNNQVPNLDFDRLRYSYAT